MNGIRNVCQTLSAAVLAVILMEAAGAAEQGCARCGGKSGVRKICRPIVTTKRVEVTYWDSVCEEFCLPKKVQCHDGGCGKCGRCGTGDHGGCGGKQDCGSCTADPCAGCCRVRTRNRLLRKTEFREIPVVYWVVEYVCDGCNDQGVPVPEAAPPPAAIPIPPAPPLPEAAPISMPTEATAGVGAGGKVRPAGFYQRKRLPIEEAIRAVWEAIP